MLDAADLVLGQKVYRAWGTSVSDTVHVSVVEWTVVATFSGGAVLACGEQLDLVRVGVQSYYFDTPDEARASHLRDLVCEWEETVAQFESSARTDRRCAREARKTLAMVRKELATLGAE